MLKRSWRAHGMLRCIPCCGFDKPVFKQRLFILRGGYLFRYVDKNSERPKGVPIPIEDATFHIVQDDEDCPCDLRIQTIRKEYYLRADSRKARDEWICELRAAKQWSIKMRMGHVKITDIDAKISKAGDELFARGLKRESDDARAMEQKFLSSSGGLY